MNRTTALAALLLAGVTTPALAEPHVWQTGDGFSIRATGLDLQSTDGRAALLKRVDVAAARLCRRVPIKSERLACAEESRKAALSAAPASLQRAAQLALAERDGTQLAGR